jgi:hypothetical protein
VPKNFGGLGSPGEWLLGGERGGGGKRGSDKVRERRLKKETRKKNGRRRSRKISFSFLFYFLTFPRRVGLKHLFLRPAGLRLLLNGEQEVAAGSGGAARGSLLLVGS